MSRKQMRALVKGDGEEEKKRGGKREGKKMKEEKGEKKMQWREKSGHGLGGS